MLFICWSNFAWFMFDFFISSSSNFPAGLEVTPACPVRSNILKVSRVDVVCWTICWLRGGLIPWLVTAVIAVLLYYAIFLWISPTFSSLGYEKSFVSTIVLKMCSPQYSRFFSSYMARRYSQTNFGLTVISSTSLNQRVKICCYTNFMSSVIRAARRRVFPFWASILFWAGLALEREF